MKFIKILVVFLIGIVMLNSSIVANEKSSSAYDPYQYFTWIIDYIESIDPFKYLGWKETGTFLEPYEYLCQSIKSKNINVETFIYQLIKLKSKDYELFKKIAHKAVDKHIIDDLKSNLLSSYKAGKKKFNITEYLLLCMLEDNVDLGYQCLIQENIYNTILNQCFINEQVLSHGLGIYQQDALTIKDVRELLLKDLIKLSQEHEIVEQLLHATAIYLKKNPDARIDFMKYDQVIASMLKGIYDYNEGQKFVGISLTGMTTFSKYSMSKKWLETLIHELTHQLMQILYNNNAKPYKKEDLQRVDAYHSALGETIIALNQNQPLLHKDQKQKTFKMNQGTMTTNQDYYINRAYDVLDIMSTYDRSQYDAEYIVRLPQIVTSRESCGANEDPKEDQQAVTKIFQPLTEYWNTYIKPDMEAYIAENIEHDNFVWPFEKVEF